MAFRRPRRETFWVGIGELLTQASPPGTAAATMLEMADIEDRTATLVRIVGTAVFRAVRTNIAPGAAVETNANEVGLGFMCQDSTGDTPSPIDDLNDERWLYTVRREIHAPGHPHVYYNAGEVIRYGNIHAAPYPPTVDFDIRVMRKFEEPCFLRAHMDAQAVSSLNAFDEISVRITARALFKAS